MRSHAIYAALLDSDSDIDVAETKKRIWPPQNAIAPLLLPVPALGGQSTRPLAGDLVPSPTRARSFGAIDPAICGRER